MSYGTWNTITIHGAGKTQPRYGEDFADEHGFDHDVLGDDVVLSGHTEGEISDEVKQLSRGRIVTHLEEYDYDETGRTETVYHAGRVFTRREDVLAPANIDKLIANAREAVAYWEGECDPYYAAKGLYEAILPIINGIDPEGAKK